MRRFFNNSPFKAGGASSNKNAFVSAAPAMDRDLQLKYIICKK